MSSGSLERRQRIREQIREFYGDPSASRDRRPAESNRSGVAPEMDLDSEFFNVGKYTTDLLRRESLKGLVETDTQLLRNVRHLDGELQELVYRNYAKFISATDTIREMRDNITEMDTKLQALSSNVESIDHVSKSISEKLQTHRSRIEEMISSNRMLRKVQFLVDLAETMGRLIERREYSACVRYWVVGDAFLAKHASLPSIAKIREECRTLAQQLYSKLRETIFATSLEDPEAMDIIRCVVEDMRLMQATSLFPEVSASSSNEGTLSAFEVEILDALMKNVSESFTTGIQGVNSAIKAALAVPSFASIERAAWSDTMQHASLQEALAQLKSTCALFSSNSERVYGLLNRANDATVSLRIVQEVQPVLIDIMAPITSHVSELLIATIEAIAADGETAMRSPSTVRHELDAVFTTLAKHLKYYAGTLKTLGVNYLDNAHSQQSRQYATLVDQSIVEILQRLLTAMSARAEEGRTLSSFPTNPSGPDAAAHFCLSRLLLGAAATCVEEVCVNALLSGDTLRAAEATPLRRHSSDVARALHNRGVVLCGQLYLSRVAVGFDGHEAMVFSGAVPHALRRAVWDWAALYVALRDGVFVSTKRGAAQAHYGGAGGSGRSSGRSARAPPHPLVVSFTRQESDALQSSVDRIFARQSQHAALRTLPRVLRATTVLVGIVIFVLKGLIEHVRQTTFTRDGFQQAQLNCTFLLHALTPGSGPIAAPIEEWLNDFGDDVAMKSTILHLINECCICAYERCTERVPLIAAVLDKSVKAAAEDAPIGTS